MSLLRHDKETTMVFRVLGSQATGVKAIKRVPVAGSHRSDARNWWIRKIHAKLGTAGVAAVAETQDVDIHTGEGAGTTLLGDDKIAFGATGDPTYPTVAPVQIAPGTLVQIANDAVHVGTAAKDLTITIVLSKIPPAAIGNVL